jgi:hypothetical protein
MLLLGYLLLALVVAALLFYAMVALLPGGLSLTPQRDNRPFELPADRRMVRADLDRVRIPVGVRGYRFAETDDLIDRLAAEIVVRDEEIARLRSQAGGLASRPAAEPWAAQSRSAESGPVEGRSEHPAVEARPAEWPAARPGESGETEDFEGRA